MMAPRQCVVPMSVRFIKLFLILALPCNAFELRMGSGEHDLERYRECGYNLAPLGDIGKLADYSEAAKGLIAPDSPLGRQIAKTRRSFDRDCEAAAKAGIAVCAGTDEVSLPNVVFQQFKNDIGLKDKINLESEAFWTLYRAKYREVLRSFPAIAYVMIRTGENYSNHNSEYVGQTVRGRKLDDLYYKHMQRLINETRAVVVDEFHRKLIWRTWDLGNEGFHASPDVYDRVLSGVKERTGLILAVKHVQTDFWQYNDFNPNIGRGGVDQIIEFQCAREYEGKGAFPNYLGVRFAEDMRRVRSMGVNGVWIWNFGGGWGGPKLKNDCWVRANIDAASRLAQNPDLKAADLAQQWAVKEFGDAAAPKIAEMLLLSPECIRKTMYVEPYALKHKGWMPSRNLMRDDIIRGERQMGLHGGLHLIYEESKNALDTALQEKLDALNLARRMLALYDEAKPGIIADRGEKVFDETRSSLLYLQSLTEVMSRYVRGMFLFYKSEETHDVALAEQAGEELTQWQSAWKRYNTEIPKLPGAATLYRSQYDQAENTSQGAMVDTCERALKAIHGPN